MLIRWVVTFAIIVAIATAAGSASGYILQLAGADALPLAVGAGFVILLALALFLGYLASLWLREPADWRRIRTEQRLWESGPLGRTWLKARQRIVDRGPR